MQHIGTIKMYTGRFGFIKRDGTTPDVFFHVSTLTAADIESIEAGARVRFDAVADDAKSGRLKATSIEVIK